MKNSILGWLIITLCSLVPLEIWATMQPLSTRFLNLAVSIASFGQAAALIGTILFCLTFLLSTRIKIVDSLFGGNASVGYMHHLLGTMAFIFLLFHPIFLAVKYATFSAASALDFILPGSNWAINFGIFSIVTMIFFLLFAFFFHIEYKKWKLMHQLLGLAFLLAIIHVLLITSDISRSFALKVYILAFTFLGAASYAYKTVYLGWILKNKVECDAKAE